jgi:hypothetical protein
MDNTIRIRRASRRLRCLLMAVLIAIPVISLLVWGFINQMPELMQKSILPPYARPPLPVLPRFLGFLVWLLPGGVAMYATANLVKLFRLYEIGQIFRPANVRCFRNLSRALIAWCLVNIASGELLSLALTAHHPPGQRMISVGFGSPDITALLVGLILSVIAWVMEEGRKMQEEQDLTV